MRFIIPQILTVDSHRSNNAIIHHCQPDLIACLIKTVSKINQTLSYFTFKETAKIMLSRVIATMHFSNATNHSSMVTRNNF